jgi:hypothetical protein
LLNVFITIKIKFMYLLKEIDDLNEAIQELQINLNNYSPYYPLPDKLKELAGLINMNTNCIEFKKYINYHCLEPLNEYILKSKEPIPDHIKDTLKYKNHSVELLKDVAKSATNSFKVAFDYFKQQ